PHNYKLTFQSTSIIISTDDSGGSTLATIPYISAIGDKFRVELANGFRFFINGILKHERTTFASSIQYPANYDLFIRPDFITASPKVVPAPALSGNWQLRPVVSFIAPSHGSISSAGPGLTTEYFNGTIPGSYTLTGKIDPGADLWFGSDRPG